jgi:hypothetical protein
MKKILLFALVMTLAVPAMASVADQLPKGFIAITATADARSDLYGTWYYVQTPDTPHEMTYHPPRVEIMPDNTATYFGYEAAWIGALSKAGKNQYRFHITREWGEGVYSEMNEEWVIEYNPATRLLTVGGNEFTQDCYTVTIETGKLRVRECPDTDCEVIGGLENGALVCPIQIIGDWAEFLYPHWLESQYRNKKAYVSVSFLKASPGAENSSPRVADSANMQTELPSGFIALAESPMSWADAKAYCQQQGGRLPLIGGSNSLRDVPRDPSTDGFGHVGGPGSSGLPSGRYWTGTEVAGTPGYSWIVVDDGGLVLSHRRQSSQGRVVCVP